MANREKVLRVGINKEPGWLFYFDNGNIMRTRMKRGTRKRQPKDKPQIVLKTAIEREDGFLYYIDAQGDVSRSVASRSGSVRKKRTAKKKSTKKAKKKGGPRKAPGYEPVEPLKPKKPRR